MGRKSTKSIQSNIVAEARERLQSCYSAERDQRELAIEDLKFAQVEGYQWGDREKKRDRPRFEVNKVAASVNQVIGDYRQNKISVKVRAAGGDATADIADTYNGLIRNIENTSNAKNAYDSAFDLLANSGFGAWRVTTKYNGYDFNQDVCIEPIRNALTKVWLDPMSTDENKRTAMYGFVLKNMSRDEAKAKWPKARISDLNVPITQLNTEAGCFDVQIDKVTIAEYWRKVPIKRTIVQLSDGRVMDLDKMGELLDELSDSGVTVVNERDVDDFKVEMYLVSGLDVLEGPQEWAGKYIPIIPVYGYNYYVDAKHYYHGLVRPAKDSQRVYNYALSANIEAVALSPKDPYWVTPKQAKGFEPQLENFNIENRPFLFYNHDPDNPGPPKRTGAPSVQSALIQTMQQAEMDMQAVTGRFGGNMQQNPSNESGRAILAQQQQGDMATQTLVDNMVKAIQYTGEILVDVLPKLYDAERQVRIIGDDGEDEFVLLNSTAIDNQTGKPVVMNDLSQGAYDVMADAGPSYQSKRTEAVNALTTLAAQDPEMAAISSDLIAKNLDFPFSNELTERLRKRMIGSGIVEPNEKEQEEMAANQPQPDPMAVMQQQLLVEREQLTNQQMQANIQATMSNANNFDAASQEKMAKVEKTMMDTQKVLVDMQKIMQDIAASKTDQTNTEADTLNKLKEATTQTMQSGEALMVSGEGMEVREDQLDLIENQINTPDLPIG